MSSTNFSMGMIGDHVTKIGSGATPGGGASAYCPAGIAFIRSQNVRVGHFGTDGLAHISLTTHQKMARSRVLPGDVLLNITGASLGRSCVFPEELGEANVNQHVCILRCDQTLLPDYLQIALERPRCQHEIMVRAAGGSREGLNFEQAARVKIPLIPMPDQLQIVNLSRCISSLIATIEDLLAAKREQKRGLMQELLTGRRRFPGFGEPSHCCDSPPSDWEVTQISDVAEVRFSNVDKHTKAGELPVRLCNYMDVWRNETIESDMSFMHATVTEHESEKFHLKLDDVLLTKDSETREDIASSAVVRSTSDDLVLGYHLALLRPDPTKLSGCFLSGQLSLSRFRNQFVRAATGATRYGLGINWIRRSEIWLPSIEEQNKIAEVIQIAQTEITHLQSLADQLREQKRGLMQRIFSGDLDLSRLKDSENEVSS